MGRSRGQIVLVAAFAMAVIFVALALILNTAIFTENLATRETTTGHDAIDFQHAVAETGDVLLRETNEDESEYPPLLSTYRDRIENYSDAETAHSITRGALRNVTLLATHNGTLISQSSDDNFENDRGNSTWLVAESVTDARAVTFNVSDVTNGPFVFNATNEEGTWELVVNKSGDEFGVSVTNTSNGTSSRSYNRSSIEIWPTNGSIAGESWSDLQFQKEFSGSFDLWIRNGSNASGTYSMVVDRTNESITWPEYDDSTDPRTTPTIYNATLGIELLRENLEYRANVTVEPEGADPR